VVNTTLAELGLEKHPDKTFIGRVEKGFTFLGYHLGPAGLRVARPTLERFAERATRLYERGRRDGSAAAALGSYVRRWWIWAEAGLDEPSGAAGSRGGCGARQTDAGPRRTREPAPGLPRGGLRCGVRSAGAGAGP